MGNFTRVLQEDGCWSPANCSLETGSVRLVYASLNSTCHRFLSLVPRAYLSNAHSKPATTTTHPSPRLPTPPTYTISVPWLPQRPWLDWPYHILCPKSCSSVSPHLKSSTVGTENAGRIGRNNLTTFLLFPQLSVRNKQPHPGMPTRVPTSKLGNSRLCFWDHLCGLASLPLTSEIRVIVLVREAECFERRGSGNTDSQVQGHYFKLPLDPCTIYQLTLGT